jgi:hypothetical protein
MQIYLSVELAELQWTVTTIWLDRISSRKLEENQSVRCVCPPHRMEIGPDF